MNYRLASTLKYFLHYALIISILSLCFFHLSLSFYWIALTVFLFTLAEASHALSLKHFFVIVIVILSSIFISSICTHAGLVWVACYLGALSCFMMWLKDHDKKYPEFFFTVLLLNILVISGRYSSTENMFILGSILLGSMIILFIKVINYPLDQYVKKIHLYCGAINALIHLNDDIFACLLQSEYKTNLYLYERRIHNRKLQYLYIVKKINKELKGVQQDECISKIKSTYDDLLDIGQLRRRVEDHATFSLCQIELKMIAAEIKKLLLAVRQYLMTKEIKIDLAPFANAVAQLNDHYHHVLQIAAKEPIVFALFIQSLNRLPQAWIVFFHDVSQINEGKHGDQ